MLRSVFVKTIRDQRRALLWWSLGTGFLTMVVCLSYPSIRDSPGINELMEGLPPALRAIAGEDIISPQGYLGSRLFNLIIPLMFSIYAIGLGTAVVAGEEERKTIGLLLTSPQSRGRIVLEKFGGVAAVLMILGLVFLLTLLLGARTVGMEIRTWALFAATVGSVLLALLFGALGLALGCATGRRGGSVGLCAAVALGTYILHSFAPLVRTLEPYRALSPFYHAFGKDPLRHGFDTVGAAVLTLAVLALAIAAVGAFRRRDVTV